MGGKRENVAEWMIQRDVLIPFPRPEDLEIARLVARSFIFDNGAFTAWRRGQPVTDWQPYVEFCKAWQPHPAFQWAIIPDVIDGTEEDNNNLICWWSTRFPSRYSVPVWHLHESMKRLRNLINPQQGFPAIAIGSSGEYATPGTTKWFDRMDKAWKVLAPNGKCRQKVHGLRMADPFLQKRYPFASVDSTNVAQNGSRLDESPPTNFWNKVLKANRIENCEKAVMYHPRGNQQIHLFQEEHDDGSPLSTPAESAD